MVALQNFFIEDKKELELSLKGISTWEKRREPETWRERERKEREIVLAPEGFGRIKITWLLLLLLLLLPLLLLLSLLPFCSGIN